ncbi:hypothetical protein EXIGLDRAFT_717981 [Exidia glandulosa HHB12029]|uniref:Uncharacterized protein n=1 Tax=Exidia glandulosa HHB12029 TaxID=1314781 RepID=A0A165P3J4_EXIGL|nr:hypothetical protein EXIGLDRAFT_717981 [Exidia glandulosa HHB12029]
MPVIAEAKRFSHAMHEAADNEEVPRLSVVICIAFRDVGEDVQWITDFQCWEDFQQLERDAVYDVIGPEYDDLEDVVRALIQPSLAKCMKKICRLDIDLPATYFEALSPGLCQPAPLLERFRLEGCPNTMATYDIRPSHDLFGGHAPLLTNASFYGNECDITLDTPVPAFARVARVSLEIDIDIHLATLPRLFPSVRHLELHLLPSVLPEGDYETLGRQLHTLSASIRLYDEDQANDICAFLGAMRSVETIHVDFGTTGENLVPVEAFPLFEHMRDIPSLCVTLTEVVHNTAPCYEICIRSAASYTRQRVVRISKEMVLSCVADLVILKATITELHLPYEFLRPCLQFTALLPSLATLHIGANRSRIHPQSECPTLDAGPMPGFADDRSGTGLWPALALVRVHVQGASSIRVQNNNLLALLKGMKVPSVRQGSATRVLEISGPIVRVIIGDGHETSLTVPLAGLFSDFRFTATAHGSPSFEVRDHSSLSLPNFLQFTSTMQYAV